MKLYHGMWDIRCQIKYDILLQKEDSIYEKENDNEKSIVDNDDDVEIATTEESATEQTTTEVDTTEKQELDETSVEAEAIESNDADSRANLMYEDEYLDYEYNEPELKICANEDGTYLVHIGIIRLTVFEDVDAIVTDAGLEFTTEDDAGNPIKGVITLEGNDAVVTFTESTWDLIPNGTAYRYYRPNN